MLDGGEFGPEGLELCLVLLSYFAVLGFQVVKGLPYDAEFVDLAADCGRIFGKRKLFEHELVGGERARWRE